MQKRILKLLKTKANNKEVSKAQIKTSTHRGKSTRYITLNTGIPITEGDILRVLSKHKGRYNQIVKVTSLTKKGIVVFVQPLYGENQETYRVNIDLVVTKYPGQPADRPARPCARGRSAQSRPA